MFDRADIYGTVVDYAILVSFSLFNVRNITNLVVIEVPDMVMWLVQFIVSGRGQPQKR